MLSHITPVDNTTFTSGGHMRNMICALASLVLVLCIMAVGTLDSARTHPPDPVVATRIHESHDYFESNASTLTGADRAATDATILATLNFGADAPVRSRGVLSTGFGERRAVRT